MLRIGTESGRALMVKKTAAVRSYKLLMNKVSVPLCVIK